MDSVLSQTYKDFEVLMVNDGSTDGSGAICQDFVERDSRFHYFEKENGGLSDARNYGLDRAKGHYITFLDSDDFLFEDYLENLYYASRLSDSDITIGGYCRFGDSNFYFYNDRFKSDSLVAFKDFQAIQYLDSMLDVTFITFSTAWGKLFKRELFSELRFPYGKYAEDQFLIWRLYMKADKIYVFNGASYVYRMNPSGLSNIFTLKHLDYIDEAKEVREKLELAEQGQYPFLTDEVKEIEVENDGELISIIIPIYNTDQYLRQCLDSIINQSYKNFEVLLINDGSVDDSATICKEYVEKDSRIRYFEKENGGVSSARNLGLKNAKGNYITFVDSDDWVEENYLEVLYNALKENKVDVAISTHKDFNMDDDLYYLPFYSEEQLHILDIGKVARDEFLELFPELSSVSHDFSCVASKLFKADLVKNLLFDESVNYGEDLDFFFSMYLKVSSVFYVNKPTYIYRQHQQSASNNCLESHAISEIRIYEKILKKIMELHIPNYHYIERFKMILYFRLGQFPNSQMLKSYESSVLEKIGTVTYSQPLISIIVPIYKVETYLRMCLNSIEHQTYSNIEVLLINDGSPDASGEICQEYVTRDSRFHYFEKENGGLSDARNYGIARAKGKFLTFIDSDDWVEPTYIEDMYQVALDNDSEIVVSNYNRFDVKENHYLIHVGDDYYEENYEGEELINELPLLERRDYAFTTSWGILFSQNLFNNIAFPKGKIIEDSRTNYKLFAKSSRSTYIHKALYNYRIGGESISSQVNEKILVDVLECVLERLAIYTIKGWNSFDEKENTLGYIRQGWEAAKEAGLQDTEIFRRYTEILNLIDNN